jgi:hypothetical protein
MRMSNVVAAVVRPQSQMLDERARIWNDRHDRVAKARPSRSLRAELDPVHSARARRDVVSPLHGSLPQSRCVPEVVRKSRGGWIHIVARVMAFPQVCVHPAKNQRHPRAPLRHAHPTEPGAGRLRCNRAHHQRRTGCRAGGRRKSRDRRKSAVACLLWRRRQIRYSRLVASGASTGVAILKGHTP